MKVHIHEEHAHSSNASAHHASSYPPTYLALNHHSNNIQQSASNSPNPSPTITQLYHFALVLVRHPQHPKYLLVQEFGNLGFWVPGGGVDRGETFSMAAVREVKEETGVDVELTGILGMDYHALPPDPPSTLNPYNGNPFAHSSASSTYDAEPERNIVRMRVIFIARPLPHAYRDTSSSMDMDNNGSSVSSSGNGEYASVYSDDNLIPKSLPDFESGGACWVDYQDIQAGKLKMRGHEPKKWSR